MATVMQMDLSSAAQAVGKALDDPINGIDSLRRQGFNFTESQKALMQSLLDTGDAAAAQKIILDELNTTYGGAAESAARSSTQIKNAWGDFLEGYGKWFTDDFNASFLGDGLVKGLSYAADALNNGVFNKEFVKGDFLENFLGKPEYFNAWYNELSLDDKIKAATLKLQNYKNIISSLNDKLESGSKISNKEKADLNDKITAEKERQAIWKDELAMLQDIQKTDQMSDG